MKRLIRALGAVVCISWGAWAFYRIGCHWGERAAFTDLQMYLCAGGMATFILFAAWTAPRWLFPIFDALGRLWDRIPE